MTEPTERKPRGYPYMSTATWVEVRNAFRRSMPRSAVTKDYLQSILGTSEKGASNLLPQLRNVGLIDGAGLPTELAKDFRDDENYRTACDKILEALYPPQLADAFPVIEDDISPITAWFMRNTGAGEASARYQSKFYVMLRKADVSELGEIQPKAAANRKSTKAPKSGATASNPEPTNKDTSAPAEHVQKTPSSDHPPTGEPLVQQTSPSRKQGARPEIHIDIQIHIASEASSDQIDAIFASMAKHLYD